MPRNERLPDRAPLMPRARLELEELEQRNLPSLTDVFTGPLLDATPASAPGAVSPLASTATAVYTPAQIRAAYGFSSLSYTGAGQTIAIVAAYDDPYVVGDLATFDSTFGLPGTTASSISQFLKKVNENGQAGSYPPANAQWAPEIALDVEWAHAIAPGANILLVEASSNSASDLLTAVNTARSTPGVSVISMSWGTSEFAAEAYLNSFFTTPAGHIGGNNQPGGITFVAAAGDSGAYTGPNWPAVMPNVLAVGGTSLSVSGYTYAGETTWSSGGGGYSQYVARPSFQSAVSPYSMRATPDVSYNANPYTGFYVYSTLTPWAGYRGFMAVGGTSAGAPQWAGLIALADQGRAQAGRPSLDGAQEALYSLPSSDFHDITSGSNGYSATAGYDPATGLGSPYANRIIPALLLVPGDPGYATSSAASPAGLPSTAPHFLEVPITSPDSPQGMSVDNGLSLAWGATDLGQDAAKTPQSGVGDPSLSASKPGAQAQSKPAGLVGSGMDQGNPTTRGTASGVAGTEGDLWVWSTDVFGPAGADNVGDD